MKATTWDLSKNGILHTIIQYAHKLTPTKSWYWIGRIHSFQDADHH